ncbi:hypothetical protein [Paenibacillus wulumuqiensis]|uniref:hypothetical protein n=1 Tax=Paenibacillus wulumuqiensis TaxID=1567107 RepID=UPI00061909DF|nr:hypothetical protein [Paenibacillus wulumuqiensis]
MEYFILKQDQRLINTAQPQQVSRLLPPELLLPERHGALDDMNLYFTVQKGGLMEPTDYIQHPVPLMSDAMRKLLILWEPSIRSYPVTLNDTELIEHKLYWLVLPPLVQALAEETSFYPDGSLKQLVLNNEQLRNYTVCQLAGIRERIILVNLGLAESILRRDYDGICLERIGASAQVY